MNLLIQQILEHSLSMNKNDEIDLLLMMELVRDLAQEVQLMYKN